MEFKDHFSTRAAQYATYRPLYPDAFFARLAHLCVSRELALDCGTGSGQAAIGLARHFDRVIAVDPSRAQLSQASTNARIEYRVAKAESTEVDPHSVDLVTAAQALHWFDAPKFFDEAMRVLKPTGAIAVWGYGDPVLDTIPLHTTLHNFNRGLLENYWSPERQLLLNGYRSIAFPFREVPFPRFVLEMRWTLTELAGYLRTWSATANYVARHGVDPVEQVQRELALHWGDESIPRIVRWPLFVRAGHITGRINGR